MGYSFLNLAEDTLKRAKKPLTQNEIWEYAQDYGYAIKVGTNGKTPWASIGAQIYINIRDNEQSIFEQVSKRPAKFCLKGLNNDEQLKKDESVHVGNKCTEAKFNERDLHPLLVRFLYINPHFKCYAKTIFHENSSKKQRGYNQWLHPDIVGVYFPFNDYQRETQKLQESFKLSSFKLFSFELKIKLNFTNLREYYFQAVSNSSWANEGYLVTLEVEDDPLMNDELRRLSNSFGIGIIILNASNIDESEILLPAKEKEFIDWDTIDRLVDENKDFKQFVCDVREDIEVNKVKSLYDKVLSEEQYSDYVKRKGIMLKE